MSPVEREYLNRLCLRIKNETDPVLFTELVVELDDFLRCTDDRRPEPRFNPPAVQTSDDRTLTCDFAAADGFAICWVRVSQPPTLISVMSSYSIPRMGC